MSIIETSSVAQEYSDGEYLRLVAESLNEGACVVADWPEGSRWIQISDELALLTAERLLTIADRMDAELEQTREAQEFRDWQDDSVAIQR